MPIYHEVFDGNQVESPTLLPTLKKVLARFAHIKRLIVVADRGLLSLDNVVELRKVMLPNGQPLEFILAVPGRKYGEFVQILKDFQSKACDAKEEIVDETRWNELRLLIAHNPGLAQEQTKLRRERIATILTQANQWGANSTGRMQVLLAVAESSLIAALKRVCTTRSVMLIWHASSRWT